MKNNIKLDFLLYPNHKKYVYKVKLDSDDKYKKIDEEI